MTSDNIMTLVAVVILLGIMLVPRWFAARVMQATPAPDATTPDPVEFAGRMIEAFAFAPGADKVDAAERVLHEHPHGVALFNIGVRRAGTLRAVWRARGHSDFVDQHSTFGRDDVTETEMLGTFFSAASVRRWYIDDVDMDDNTASRPNSR